MALPNILENNRQYAKNASGEKPDLLANLCGQQSPTYLWFGRWDRRVFANVELGLVDSWIQHIKDVRENHCLDLAAIDDEGARADRLCELNVLDQVRNVCDTTVVRDAWRRGGELFVHGWVYRLSDGLLRDLDLSVSSQVEIASLPNG
jgi:carbonic anhydrase